ncbi:MAG: hypothetical protein ACHQJ6_03765, partial [Candidatus Berkiellales bacterium]
MYKAGPSKNQHPLITDLSQLVFVTPTSAMPMAAEKRKERIKAALLKHLDELEEQYSIKEKGADALSPSEKKFYERISPLKDKEGVELTAEQMREIYNTPYYVQAISGKEEDKLLETVKEKKLDKELHPITLRELKEEYDAVLEEQKKRGSPKSGGKLEVVTGLDVTELVTSPASEGSITVISSQANALEAKTPVVTRLSSYPSDKTHGPRGAMPCLNELAKRQNAGFDAFSKMLSGKDRKKYIRNGYIQYGKKPEKFLKLIQKHPEELQLLAMRSNPELADHTLMQAFAFASPFNKHGNGGDEKAQLEIAKAILISQFEALARMAVIRAHRTGQPVTLNLALVGAGDFANPEEVLNEAFKKVKEIVKDQPVNVAIHDYKGDCKYQALEGVPRIEASEFLDREAAKRERIREHRPPPRVVSPEIAELRAAPEELEPEVIPRLRRQPHRARVLAPATGAPTSLPPYPGTAQAPGTLTQAPTAPTRTPSASASASAPAPASPGRSKPPARTPPSPPLSPIPAPAQASAIPAPRAPSPAPTTPVQKITPPLPPPKPKGQTLTSIKERSKIPAATDPIPVKSIKKGPGPIVRPPPPKTPAPPIAAPMLHEYEQQKRSSVSEARGASGEPQEKSFSTDL